MGSSAGQAGERRNSALTKALVPPLYRGEEGGVLEGQAHSGAIAAVQGGFPQGQMATKNGHREMPPNTSYH